MSGVRKSLKNDYVLSLFDKVYSIIIGIISSAFYVRYLGLEYKGTYSYINEITTIIGLIINFGIYQSYPFFYRKEGHSIFKKYLSTFLIQFILYTMFSAIVGAIVRDKDIIVMYICFQLPLLVLKTQMDNVIIVENIRLYMWVDITLKTVLAVIYFLLWALAPVDIGYMVASTVVTNLLVCIAYILMSDHADITLKPNVKFIKDVTKFGFYPMLSALLMTLNYSVDIIFLENMGTKTELSLYSVASVLINYVWILPNAFKEVLISKVARDDAENQVAFSCRISLFITTVCLIGFAMLGRFAVKMIFGKEFMGCYSVTIILFIGAFSMIFFKMLGVVFVAEGKQREYFVILLISVIANIAANFALIPIWGMYGAAVASVTSYTICGFGFLLRYCKWKKTKIKRYLLLSREDISHIINAIRRRRDNEKETV